MSNATKPTNPKEDSNQPSSGHRKTSTPATRAAEQTPQKCPRCDSPNTKFCYYNNYSLTQPRHFCKTCRRYWTKGGALRNVPVGGGCRKNKKLKSNAANNNNNKDSSSSSSSIINNLTSSSSFSDHHHHFIGGSGFMNLKLFHGISPAMDFNLGGLQANNSTASLLMGGFDYQNPSNTHNNSLLSLASGSNNNNNSPSSLASSIESLSSINQDLHWKLQQQRLAMLFGGGNGNNNNIAAVKTKAHHHGHHQTAVPILFQNLEISKPGGDDARKDDRDQVVIGSDQTVNIDQWFFGINSNSYNNNNINSGGQVVQLAHHNHHQGVNNTTITAHQGQTNNGNENVTGGTNTSNWINNVNWTTSTSADLHQFSASLP